jgi:tetratricopeptide (TPR) repeat protein
MSISLNGRVLSPAIALAILLVGRLGAAQSASEFDVCQEDPLCTKLAERGKSALTQGQYDVALKAYQHAYSYQQSPRLLYNLARVMHKLSRPIDAASHYRQYIAVGKQEPPAQIAKAEHYLKEVEAEIEEMKAKSLKSPKPAPPPTPPQHRSATSGWRNGKLPAWRLGVGIGLLGAGVVLSGFGISGLTQDGSCQEQTEAGWDKPQCLRRHESRSSGTYQLGGGLALGVTGALFIAVPLGWQPREASVRLAQARAAE